MEVGRVVLVAKGPDAGKVATIVEIVDQNRAVIDGPTTGVARQVILLRHLNLTDLMVKKLPRSARSKTLRKALLAQKTVEEWAATPAAKELAAKKKRSELNDFERFKVMLLKRQKKHLLGTA